MDPHWCGELKARTERTLLFYHHRLNQDTHQLVPLIEKIKGQIDEKIEMCE